MSGLAGLLNLGAPRHWTVFVSDFTLPDADVRRLRRETESAATRVLFAGVDRLEQQLKNAAIDVANDYVSLHLVSSKFASISRVRELFMSMPNADMTRVDLPFAGVRFRRAFATHALDVVLNADYEEQDRFARRFFHHLEQHVPYKVVIQTKDGAELIVADESPWFQLAGKMQRGEFRTLPGGEVAYTRDRINGEFTVDGALLCSPAQPGAARTAARLNALSRHLSERPLRLRICDGKVTEVAGDAELAHTFRALMRRDERYTAVTEVGISFNRACATFIHDWPAASNEGRPGVHIAIGGDPERDDKQKSARQAPVVHIDFMAATSAVYVNGTPFLKTT